MRPSPVPPVHQRWGVAGTNGPVDASSVYVPERPFPSSGTSDFQNKVLGTLVRGRVPSTDHPRRIGDGVASPELSYFDKALRR
jgi:hypothetical protein